VPHWRREKSIATSITCATDPCGIAQAPPRASPETLARARQGRCRFHLDNFPDNPAAKSSKVASDGPIRRRRKRARSRSRRAYAVIAVARVLPRDRARERERDASARTAHKASITTSSLRRSSLQFACRRLHLHTVYYRASSSAGVTQPRTLVPHPPRDARGRMNGGNGR